MFLVSKFKTGSWSLCLHDEIHNTAHILLLVTIISSRPNILIGKAIALVLVMWGEHGVSNDAETEPLFGQLVRWEAQTKGFQKHQKIALSCLILKS